jgi:histone acetyltransferase (RNA polymerase elongator complex component)
MRYIYNKYYSDTPLNKTFGRYLIKKAMRSRSGVLVTTVVLEPSVFSCPKKCSYCPTETDLEGRPTQPKSYLSTEPAMLRAIQYNFDVKGQIWDRIKSYINTGNIRESSGSVKMEVILSGGTWESYPYKYRDRVMNEIYWAANTKVWWKVVFFGLVALLVQPFLRPVFTSFVWFRIDIGLGLALVAYSFLDGYLSNED